MSVCVFAVHVFCDVVFRVWISVLCVRLRASVCNCIWVLSLFGLVLLFMFGLVVVLFYCVC